MILYTLTFRFFRYKRFGYVMVSMIGLNVVDCVFDPRSGKTKDYKIGKDQILVTFCMFPNGATCLSVDCCVNVLAL
jgi:hypothetical protein